MQHAVQEAQRVNYSSMYNMGGQRPRGALGAAGWSVQLLLQPIYGAYSWDVMLLVSWATAVYAVSAAGFSILWQ